MPHQTSATAVARRIADKTLGSAAGVDAFVIVSSVDLDIALEKGNHRDQARRQLVGRRKSLPDARVFCDAVEAGGLAAARAVAETFHGEPRAVWWCESRAEFEQVLGGIYERLRRSARPHDAYDGGVCGPLAWVVVWRD